MTMVPAGRVALELGARFGKDAPPIIVRPDLAGLCRQGRIAPATIRWCGKRQVALADDACCRPAAYIVHVGFGLANAVKP